MAGWRAKQRRRGRKSAFYKPWRFPRDRPSHSQQVERTAICYMKSMKWRLRAAICPKSWRNTNPWGQGTSMLSLQINSESMCVLGMLEEKPGAVEWLFASCASVTARLILPCKRKQIMPTWRQLQTMLSRHLETVKWKENVFKEMLNSTLMENVKSTISTLKLNQFIFI